VIATCSPGAIAREVSDPALTREKPPEPQPRPPRSALDEAKAALDAAIKRHRQTMRRPRRTSPRRSAGGETCNVTMTGRPRSFKRR
jgi:hypothetical protein